MNQGNIPLVGIENCGNCQFAGNIDNQGTMPCRRMPPTRLLVPTPAGKDPRTGVPLFPIDAGWPQVNSDSWCGEWKRKIHLAKIDEVGLAAEVANKMPAT